MEIINKSRKIIGINGEPLLPGATIRLPDGTESHPVIADYLAKGIVADVKNDIHSAAGTSISGFEKAKIAEEAIAQYKKQQEEVAEAETKAAQKAKEAEIKAVKGLKKEELLLKAVGMGLEVKDDDKVEDLKEKIIAAINQ